MYHMDFFFAENILLTNTELKKLNRSSVLEDKQGNRVSLLSPAHRQWTPEPDGLLCHVHHVQGKKMTILIIS